MTSCKRFEQKELLKLERGRPLDDHTKHCSDCQAEMAAFECLKQAIHDLENQHEPPEDWQERVWKSIEREESRPTSWPLWVKISLPITTVVTTLAALAIFVFGETRNGPKDASLNLTFQRGNLTLRGKNEPKPGDRLIIRATTGDYDYAELRVYFNDTDLRLRCSNKPPCRHMKDGLMAETSLDAVGEYQALLLVSDTPLPKTSSSPDEDAIHAFSAGAKVVFKKIQVW